MKLDGRGAARRPSPFFGEGRECNAPNPSRTAGGPGTLRRREERDRMATEYQIVRAIGSWGDERRDPFAIVEVQVRESMGLR